MKYNRLIIKGLAIGAVCFLATACTDKFSEYNKNPYQPDDLGPDSYNVRAALSAMQGIVIPLDVNTAQFTDCLLGGAWGGYLADSNAGFNNRSLAVYNPQDDWVKPLMVETMKNIFINRDQIYKYTDDPVIRSVADILKVIAMLRVTDAYGSIPYSKVGKDGKLEVPYDSQEEVYAAMFNELDGAIEILTKNRTANFNPKADKVYGGITEKWAKLANSVKLRMAIRISLIDPTKAKAKAEEVISSEVGPMSGNDDNAYMADETRKNPFEVVMYEYNGGDSRISADITSYMNGYNDPRRDKYFTPSTFTVPDGATWSNGYIGLRSGVSVDASSKLYCNMKVGQYDKLLWMNAAEVAFLKAEGALRGWDMGGTAETFYNEGIRLSFGQWGADGADAYLNDATSMPQAFNDPVNTQYSNTGASATITIKWDDAATTAVNLERIITQKWIANFPLGLEAWAEFRRTGYPLLMPAVENQSNGVIDDVRRARRLNYPLIEYTNNATNVAYAVANYLNGPDNMGTDVWWATAH